MPVGGDMADFLAHRGGDADAVRKELDEAVAKRRAGADEDDETAPLDRPLEWDPFPTHILPEVMRLMIQQGARATVCDESFIALPMLAVLGAAIGNSRRVQVKRN